MLIIVGMCNYSTLESDVDRGLYLRIGADGRLSSCYTYVHRNTWIDQDPVCGNGVLVH